MRVPQPVSFLSPDPHLPGALPPDRRAALQPTPGWLRAARPLGKGFPFPKPHPACASTSSLVYSSSLKPGVHGIAAGANQHEVTAGEYKERPVRAHTRAFPLYGPGNDIELVPGPPPTTRVTSLGGQMNAGGAWPVTAVYGGRNYRAVRRGYRSHVAMAGFVSLIAIMIPGCDRVDENGRPAAPAAPTASLSPSSKADVITVSICPDLISDGVSQVETPFGWFCAIVARGRPDLGGDARDLHVVPEVTCAAEFRTMAFRFNDDHDASKGVSLVVTRVIGVFRPEGERQRPRLPKDEEVVRSIGVRGVLCASRADVSIPGTVIAFNIVATGIGGAERFAGTIVTP